MVATGTSSATSDCLRTIAASEALAGSVGAGGVAGTSGRGAMGRPDVDGVVIGAAARRVEWWVASKAAPAARPVRPATRATARILRTGLVPAAGAGAGGAIWVGPGALAKGS